MEQQSNRYVFLVDDEPIQNEMLKDYISERFQYKLKTYDNGEDALKDMALDPEIVILDYHLNAHMSKAQNGVEILKKIKEVAPATQVVMLSGQDNMEVAIDSMKYGAYDYVIKGETAFSRMENVLNNITDLHFMQAANRGYKKIIGFLIAAIVAIVIISAILIRTLH
jgi:two-component system, OmpR family, response regulator